MNHAWQPVKDAKGLLFCTGVAGAGMQVAAMFDMSPLDALVAAGIALVLVLAATAHQLGKGTDEEAGR